MRKSLNAGNSKLQSPLAQVDNKKKRRSLNPSRPLDDISTEKKEKRTSRSSHNKIRKEKGVLIESDKNPNDKIDSDAPTPEANDM